MCLCTHTTYLPVEGLGALTATATLFKVLYPHTHTHTHTHSVNTLLLVYGGVHGRRRQERTSAGKREKGWNGGRGGMGKGRDWTGMQGGVGGKGTSADAQRMSYNRRPRLYTHEHPPTNKHTNSPPTHTCMCVYTHTHTPQASHYVGHP